MRHGLTRRAITRHGFTRHGFTRHGAGPIAAALLACAALAACGAAGSPGSATLTLYSGQHVQTAQNLIAAFERQTGIKVALRSDDEDTLANQIATEGANSPADLLYTENTPPLESLAAKGLLAPVSKATLSHTPSQYNSPVGDWVGISARTSLIVYNPSLISASQLPTRISQFAAPRYKGKLAIAPQETDFQPIVTAYDQAYGKAATLSWLGAIKSNAAGHVYSNSETVVSQVNRGAIAFAVVNQYYWYRMRAEIGAERMKAQITHLAPRDPGYVIDVSGAAVLKSSKHQAQAQRFLAFLVSKKGQDIIAHPGTGPGESISFEYPLASGVTTLAPETPFSQLQPYPITMGQLGTGTTAIDLMRQAGLL
ncbi:MAG TPA: extracellular solute-binding protein [Streptosporangiaceae bacterium]|nr:extracellular solute-binding protein [Streptosporangiaceae bacterium]